MIFFFPVIQLFEIYKAFMIVFLKNMHCFESKLPKLGGKTLFFINSPVLGNLVLFNLVSCVDSLLPHHLHSVIILIFFYFLT